MVDFESKMKVLILSTLLYAQFVSCANILGLFPLPSYSHFSLGFRILDEMLERGHNITMVTPVRSNKEHENYTEVYIEGLYDFLDKQKHAFYDMEGQTWFGQLLVYYSVGYIHTEYTLNDPNVQALIKSDSQFDVILMDQYLNDGLLGFSHIYKAPVVYLSSMGPTMWNNDLVGNPAPLSYIPSIFIRSTGDMNLWQRLKNVQAYYCEEIYRRLISFPTHNDIMHKHFPNAPHIYDLVYSNPLILLNSHHSSNAPIPLMGSMVEIGGFHINPKPLPADLKKYLDDSKNGVVFFSMGSNLRSSSLPVEKRNAILNVFRKLKMNVLWKWEDDSLPNQPENVRLGKWLPQQAILSHPNVKAFISHGGLLSTIEAVYFGVPIIGIPIFGDQKINMKLAEDRGYALQIDYQTLSEENLTWALNEILNNKRYLENIKNRSQLMNDRPIKPIDEAIYWIEHVIRHKGVKHLRNASMNLKWYQYEMLDVAAVILIALYVVYKALSITVRSFVGKRKQAKLKSN